MDTKKKPKVILTMLQYYEPGYKAGGPITTIKNSIHYLSDQYRFRVVTSDRDLGDRAPYPLLLDQWITGISEVIYISRGNCGTMLKLLKQEEYDILYANSFFSYAFSIRPIFYHHFFLRSRTKVIVAPRGEFSAGALSLNTLKKRCFIGLSKALGLYKHVTWQASSEIEKQEIQQVFGKLSHVIVAPDLPSKANYESQTLRRTKVKGLLRLVFLSRVSKMKNLDFALKSMQHVTGQVLFTIYGPIEDILYWESCQAIADKLPANITVEYKGAVRHDEVKSCMEQNDVFYLPTLGEGFGHAIFEALQSACPVLLSDRTPWNDVADANAGVVLPLEEPNGFAQAVQQFVDMDAEAYSRMSVNAYAYSLAYMRDSQVIKAHRSLFDE
ncbi:glycosyltransferase family 4 protein [Paenibacillus periandrae]|uniref:glycosyltransferase family 4 protein n=1 Tax=Paenibacillus periandrae TaxID=1761741 RepID=UPI001F08E50C